MGELLRQVANTLDADALAYERKQAAEIKAAYTELVRANHDEAVRVQCDRAFAADIINIGLGVLYGTTKRHHAVAFMRSIVAQYDARQAARALPANADET